MAGEMKATATPEVDNEQQPFLMGRRILTISRNTGGDHTVVEKEGL